MPPRIADLLILYSTVVQYLFIFLLTVTHCATKLQESAADKLNAKGKTISIVYLTYRTVKSDLTHTHIYIYIAYMYIYYTKLMLDCESFLSSRSEQTGKRWESKHTHANINSKIINKK